MPVRQRASTSYLVAGSCPGPTALTCRGEEELFPCLCGERRAAQARARAGQPRSGAGRHHRGGLGAAARLPHCSTATIEFVATEWTLLIDDRWTSRICPFLPRRGPCRRCRMAGAMAPDALDRTPVGPALLAPPLPRSRRRDG